MCWVKTHTLLIRVHLAVRNQQLISVSNCQQRRACSNPILGRRGTPLKHPHWSSVVTVAMLPLKLKLIADRPPSPLRGTASYRSSAGAFESRHPAFEASRRRSRRGFRGEVPSDVSRITCRIDGGGGAVEPRDDKGLQYVIAGRVGGLGLNGAESVGSDLTGPSRWART